MDRPQLADFLRRRRAALQPEDVGVVRGARRRTRGLRREEVAALCDMSVDYYSRLEQARGPRPSEQILASMARGLRLTLAERDHLFRLAGHHAPARDMPSHHISPALMRVMDRMQDTPAQVMTHLGEALLQTHPARMLFGDEAGRAGLDRSVFYRWFTDPSSREVYPSEDHDLHGRNFTSDLRAVYARQGPRSEVATLVDTLLDVSPEFERMWEEHEVGARHDAQKRLQHPEVGIITVHCQLLHDVDQAQALLVFTATPGTEDHDKLELLNVLDRKTARSAH